MVFLPSAALPKAQEDGVQFCAPHRIQDLKGYMSWEKNHVLTPWKAGYNMLQHVTTCCNPSELGYNMV
jgi:hypothetical protein